jgi:hypothetical protein
VITDSIYGVLSDTDVKERIASLGDGDNDTSELEVAEKGFQRFLEFMALKKKMRKG